MTLEDRLGRAIDIMLPGREDADMAPIAQVCADGRAGLIELHWQTSLDEMGGGGKPDRTGADHGDGKRGGAFGHVTGPSLFLEPSN